MRMARENLAGDTYGSLGECRKLGIRVSAMSVRRILRLHRLGPAPGKRAGLDGLLRAPGRRDARVRFYDRGDDVGFHPCHVR